MSDFEDVGPSDRWMRIEALFEEALELPAARRGEFLDRTTADDPSLRASVERMLAADSRDFGFLDLPFLPGGGPIDPDAIPEESSLPAGTRIGPYRIVAPIARGGMGAVYRAARADGAYEQEVALKVVRGSWIAHELERRFLRERQILARLDHPAIARLIDGGLTEEGSPYLAMELVAGEPITRWASASGPDLAMRLRVFLDVCGAVAYAHQNLVLHRDLKPSNILVTDARRVRLLDFGIARLLESPGDEPGSEALTRSGTLLLTPEYAAPEQLRGEPTSTATDVYSLGAVLYELLSGRRAFVLEARSWNEIARILRDDPPPIGRARDLEPKARRRLAGDLETIVRKAMHKEPARRYASVDALAADIQRHLEGRPVSARPDTFRYRIAKYARRHRAGLAAVAAVVLAVLMGTGATLRQARATEREAFRAEAVRDFLFGLFEAADPDQNLGEIPDARELLDLGAARIDSLGPGVGPEIRTDLLTMLGVLYRSLGQFEESGALLERAVRTSRVASGDDARTAAAWDGLAATLIEAGELDSAEVAGAEGLRIREAIRAPDAVLAESHSTLGTIAQLAGRLDEGVEHHRRALELDRGRIPGDHERIVTDMNNLGLALSDADEYEEALALLEASLPMSRRVYGDRHPQVAIALGNLASAVGSAGDLARAAELHREALDINRAVYGERHPEVARSLDQWAVWLDRQGRHAEADSISREALAMRESLLGSDHSDVGATLTNIATTRYRSGDFSGAAEMQARALDIWLRTYGEDHPRTAVAITNLGAMQLRAGDLRGAEENLTLGLQIRRRLSPGGSEDVGSGLRNLGDLRRAQGRSGEALEHYDEARTMLDSLLGPDHWRLGDVELGRGAVLVDSGREMEAIAPLREALRIRAAAFVDGDLRIAEARLWLGLALAAADSAAGARPLLESAKTAFENQRGPDDQEVRRAAGALRSLR